MTEKPKPEPKDRDEPVTIPLDPEVALRALLQVQPEDDVEHEKTSGSGPRDVPATRS